MNKNFFIITTIADSLNFFTGQIKELSKIYNITLISSDKVKLRKIADKEEVNYKDIEMKRDISVKQDIISFIRILFYFIFHRPYAIHCNTPKASLLSLVAGFFLKIPVRIYYVHGLRYEGASGKKRKFLIAIEKISCFCATDIIAVSYGVRKEVESVLTSKKVSVIHHGSPNGLNIKDFSVKSYDLKAIRDEYSINKEDFVFGFVGRLVGDKGINELVHAFNKLEQRNIKLLLIGRYETNLDPLKQETLDIIKENPNIIEFGFQSDVKKFLSIMDLFVSPSYREGFGLSVLEANLMQIPVLVSKITGYSEIVIEDKNGFFIDSKNENDLYEKMNELLESKNKLIAMKKKCRSEVVVKYDHESVLKHALLYYSQFK